MRNEPLTVGTMNPLEGNPSGAVRKSAICFIPNMPMYALPNFRYVTHVVFYMSRSPWIQRQIMGPQGFEPWTFAV